MREEKYNKITNIMLEKRYQKMVCLKYNLRGKENNNTPC